ncbi:MAG: hypothetical protein KW802_00190 [Candidatus Doudnabacteria bacterium]|nr:hypothetical protein [Candidatus Doudnabacteria bacterium]
MIASPLSQAWRILFSCLALIGFASWALGLLFSLSNPWLSLGLGFVALGLEMARQHRLTQLYLVWGAAFFAGMLRFDYVSWHFQPIGTFLLWVALVAFAVFYVVGWLFSDSRMFQMIDNDEELELDSGQQSPYHSHL